MFLHPLALAILSCPAAPPLQGDRVQELRAAATVAEKANQLDRVVYLLRAAYDEALLRKDKEAQAQIQALLSKFSPKEKKQRKLLSGAARSLRKVGISHMRQKHWADALELLLMAEGIERSVDGTRALVTCLFDAGEGRLPFEKIVRGALANDSYQREGGNAFRWHKGMLVSPGPNATSKSPAILESRLASMPGLMIDCEMRLPAAESKAGIFLGSGDSKQVYVLAEMRRWPGEKRLDMGGFRYNPPPRVSYSPQGSFWEDVDVDAWLPLHIEVRSSELSIAIGDGPLRVLPVANATMDGHLCFEHVFFTSSKLATSFRNFRIRPLLAGKSIMAELPRKLQGHEIDVLFASSERAAAWRIDWLAKAYLERVGILASLSSNEEDIRKRQMASLKKVDRLLGATLSARKSAAKRLAALAHAEEKDGRMILAARYRTMCRSVAPVKSPKVVDADAIVEDKKKIDQLFPSVKNLFARAQTLGGLGAWNYQKGTLVSPFVRNKGSSLLLLPSMPAAGCLVEFSIDPRPAILDFVFGQRSGKDRFVLRFKPMKGYIVVILEQRKDGSPIVIFEMYAKMPSSYGKSSIPVTLLLRDHDLSLRVGPFAPRIIPLERRRLQGRMGFQLPAGAPMRPIRFEGLRIH